ncbi:MAG TPA: hypothetical protein VMB71_15305 [Acetobacteraceae bacterium]|nr:hypothetical protein [Acetobacteraceae bacterium]
MRIPVWAIILPAGLMCGLAYAATDQPAKTPEQTLQGVITRQSATAAAVRLHARTEAPPYPTPSFTVFGQKVLVWAPLPPPYSNSAYRDLGGQPETSRDMVLDEGAHGRPLLLPRGP